MKIKFICAIFGLSAVISSCTIRPPDVTITSEKTSVEKQLFGESEDDDTYPLTLAGAWGVFTDPGLAYNTNGRELPENQDHRAVVLAQIRRRTLNPYLDEMKKQGLIGESNSGYLVVRDYSLDDDPALKKIIDAENSDREIIWGDFIKLNNLKSEKEKEAVRINFAGIAARLSPSGTWLQNENGAWNKKE